uniref:Translation machinery-associated protein 16 n=1 Tax=Lygus hesperus TaxID=30085 RepID=A0A0A9WZ41_LYGHE
MVKSRKEKQSESKALSINHPNSRKALRLAKQVIKEAARNKSKSVHMLKRNVLGEKLLWFQEHLQSDILVYTPELLSELIQKYIARNDEELEQIQLKHSIGQRKNRQHASREDAIRLTKERDLEEFNGSGIEMVDILVPKMLEAFRKWDGNYGRLGLMKMAKFSRSSLERYKLLPVSKELLEKQDALRSETATDVMDGDEEKEEMDLDCQDAGSESESGLKSSCDEVTGDGEPFSDK